MKTSGGIPFKQPADSTHFFMASTSKSEVTLRYESDTRCAERDANFKCNVLGQLNRRKLELAE